MAGSLSVEDALFAFLGIARSHFTLFCAVRNQNDTKMRALSVVLAVPLLGTGMVSPPSSMSLAQKAGKKYFGTATDTGELSNTTYFDILTKTSEFKPAHSFQWSKA